ncbi:MAG: 16S rRNA (cytosine(1402)-N(4))-methyltransferase RsmH [Bacteroidaceae bacterium]|nr:16S rRNA (cytosine(1402)-N(4))-methyltransferase RsmH [Bacteroidaceae bacterium]MBQ2978803.1 16S rRNA (cytosine(1402)-N(4))-methyltransferase RsmH [Bacteroidaceae bacterium]
MQQPVYHIPALLEECMQGLDIKPSGTYVDVTFGGGGHSREILSRLGKDGHLYSFDQDEDAQRNIVDDERFTFVYSNFKYLKNFMLYHGVEGVDGILADLGVSFHHFDESERGFSFRFDAPLDMRMNKKARLTAAEILATYSDDRLAQLFALYGEMRNARRIASAIVARRASGGVKTTGELLDVVAPFINRKQEKKELAQIFQSLRIEVNNEMDSLKSMLNQATQLLKPGGRLVVITYHSLEDRIVKNFIKTGNVEGVMEKDFYGRVKAPLQAVNNKVIVPTDEEVERNPRARSAKLRIAQKM